MATLPYRPRHKEPMRSDEYLDLEVIDFNAFLAGDHVELRGRHHMKAADSVVRAYEIRERLSRGITAIHAAAAESRVAA